MAITLTVGATTYNLSSAGFTLLPNLAAETRLVSVLQGYVIFYPTAVDMAAGQRGIRIDAGTERNQELLFDVAGYYAWGGSNPTVFTLSDAYIPSSGGGSAATAVDREIISYSYSAIAAGTGYSIGDQITRSDIYSVVATAALVATLYYNNTTKLYLGTVPLAVDLQVLSGASIGTAQVPINATILVAGTAQNALPANASRKAFEISNNDPAGGGLLWVNFSTAAGTDLGFPLYPGGSYVGLDAKYTGIISVFSLTAGVKYVVSEVI